MEERQDKAWKLENIASFAKNKKGAQPKGEDKLSMRYDFVKRWLGRGSSAPSMQKKSMLQGGVWSCA